jgi:hypothetical protein
MNNRSNPNLIWIAVLTALVALVLTGCTTVEPTVQVVSTSTSTVTTAPIETPTSAPTPTPAPLVWWQPELYKVEDVGTGKTYLMAPQEVVDEVIAHQKQADDLLAIADLEAYKVAMPRYYTGKMLEEQMAQAEESVKYEIIEEGINRAYEVKDFSADGLECTLGMTQRDGRMIVKNRQTGETQEGFSELLTIVRMRYDLDDQRWKMAETIEIIPLGQ